VDGAAAGARSIDAFHLPGLPAAAPAEWEVLSVPGTDLVVRVPVLEPDHIDRVCERLAAARAERLPDGDARGVAAVLARSARRMRRAALEEANRAAIAGLAGLSAPMVDRILDGMAAGWSEESLTGLLTAEFGEPSVPHRFAPDPARPGIRTRAVAPDVAFHVFAGNVPGVAVTSMIRSLLVGSAVIGKTAREGPLLPALFARALQQEDPALAQCLAVTWWPGGSARLETRVLERAKLAVVYGGADAVRAVHSLAPASTRVVVHGPGVSVGLILKGALTAANAARLAGDAALAIATFDQRGCTSPVALIVEEGGEMSPARFAAALGEELDRLAVILPAGAPAPGPRRGGVARGGGRRRRHPGNRLGHRAAHERGARRLLHGPGGAGRGRSRPRRRARRAAAARGEPADGRPRGGRPPGGFAGGGGGRTRSVARDLDRRHAVAPARVAARWSPPAARTGWLGGSGPLAGR
jgi:hypothetical protein